LQKIDRYYALCREGEKGEREIAFFHLRDDEELGRLLGMAVYTSLDGDLQRQHLRTYAGTDEDVVIAPVSPEELLDAMNRGYPTTVSLDDRKLAGSVFKGMIMGELGLPIKRPRPLRIDAPDD